MQTSKYFTLLGSDDVLMRETNIPLQANGDLIFAEGSVMETLSL